MCEARSACRIFLFKLRAVQEGSANKIARRNGVRAEEQTDTRTPSFYQLLQKKFFSYFLNIFIVVVTSRRTTRVITWEVNYP